MSKDMLGPLVRASVKLTELQMILTLGVVDRFTGDRRVEWEAHLRNVLSSGLPSQSTQSQADKPSLLTPVNARIQIDAITSYNPKEFKTREGLEVSNDFQSRVGRKAKSVKNLGAITLTSADLVRSAYDTEIKADLLMPANLVFQSNSEFVACLDQMIQKQSNGEEGNLLKNGYWNIFYVADCVVLVYWNSHRRLWVVNTWMVDVSNWHAGNRAFGRN